MYANVPPLHSSKAIGSDLLDTAYMEVQVKVQSILAEQNSLQFVLDESPDINHRRMVNLSIVIPKGLLF